MYSTLNHGAYLDLDVQVSSFGRLARPDEVAFIKVRTTKQCVFFKLLGVGGAVESLTSMFNSNLFQVKPHTILLYVLKHFNQKEISKHILMHMHNDEKPYDLWKNVLIIFNSN